MMNYKLFSSIVLMAICFVSCTTKTIDLADYGVKPDTKENSSPLFAKAIESIKEEVKDGKKVRITLPAGRYDFYPEESSSREYFISNHDQNNPKNVGIALEDINNVTFDAQGSEFVFHGRMLPVSLLNSENIKLTNFSIDFENPHISQISILENDTINGVITYEIAPWVEYEIRDSVFVAKGEGWEHTPSSGIAFEKDTRHIVYQTSDIGVGTRKVIEIAPRTIQVQWNNKKLIPGTVVAMRAWKRPTPGIFLSHNKNTTLENIKIHYAEGMGVLAQMSENITLDKLSVCLKGDNDPRYFTTQADATHFSGCKGKITSINGLYEGMMDDAINIHGTYLKVMKRIDDQTLEARYMHSQCYGFEWGMKGDKVQFVKSKTMEIFGETNTIKNIEAVDMPTHHEAKLFKITFEQPLDSAITEDEAFGIENLEWTPEVLFANNTIRNNRARGTLFSTPKKTIVENNTFDHTSGTAILLCGDCNGWYETGACKEVIIRNNTFVNALTNMFQFTNAIISIYPEIPDLNNQNKYFHSNIVIENNTFNTFDNPILYAKSVDGLTFRNNTVHNNNDYPAFHWNKHPFYFQRVVNFTIEDNTFDYEFDKDTHIRVE
ncbi:hypothetical protein M2138_000907 [Dysgonomonadaceae bacterium PH5-43]|nr:hypothetical protein [Dysgonomonadaceae bacterium PH5-43]